MMPPWMKRIRNGKAKPESAAHALKYEERPHRDVCEGELEVLFEELEVDSPRGARGAALLYLL